MLGRSSTILEMIFWICDLRLDESVVGAVVFLVLLLPKTCYFSEADVGVDRLGSWCFFEGSDFLLEGV